MKKIYLITTSCLFSYTAFCQQYYNQFVLKTGPSIIMSQEKQIASSIARKITFDFSICYNRSKKMIQMVGIDFIASNLDSKNGPTQKFYNGSFFYDLFYPVIKKNRLVFSMGNGIHFSGTYYKVRTFYSTVSTGTALLPFTQCFLLKYDLNNRVKIEFHSSLSLLTTIYRAGYANHMNEKKLFIGSLFNKNYLVSTSVSVTKNISKRWSLGAEWQNFFQHIDCPAPQYTSRLLRNNIFFSIHFIF